MSESKDSARELLRVDNLRVHFPVGNDSLFSRATKLIKAVDDVSFHVGFGETLGLVGESGCGKSTSGLAVLRMLPATAGQIRFEDNDISAWTPRQMRPLRRRIQMIYQDPYGSLDPRMRVRDIIGEPLIIHDLARSRKAYNERVAELLMMVGLVPAMAERYPHEFSGGQRQRIGIARALAVQPALIVCDEPVSALDVSVQAQIVNLMMDLQAMHGIAYLFIAHDLAVVRHIAGRVAVMYLGKIVEIADREHLYTDPLHPYTQALLAAVPIPDPLLESRRQRVSVQGEVPSAINLPTGCRFRKRCPHALRVCDEHDPALRAISSERSVACHLHV